MKKGLKSLAVLAVSVLSLAGCGGETGLTNTGSAKTKVKVGLITLHDSNSTYDKNFIDAMTSVCEKKGVELIVKSGIAEETVCYDTAADLADQGCNLVFADSFGHEEHMIKAAREFPDVQFAHATGTQSKQVNLKNFHNAFASIYEGRYLAGVTAGLKIVELKKAGKLEAKNFDDDGNVKIGYVGAYTYAEVISGYTSYYLGVKSIIDETADIPGVVMDVTFTGSWYDETKEKESANNLISRGAAVISQHADSMGAPSACETAGVPNVSYNGSTASRCPNTFLVSSKINWAPYYEYLIDSVANGTEIDTEYSGTIDTDSVQLTELGTACAAGTAEKIAEVKAKLKAGTLHVFDTSKFTVTKAEGKNAGATVDADGHLTAYLADIDGDFAGETNVVENGVFEESKLPEYRSAPYFDVQIDGINLLDVNFGD